MKNLVLATLALTLIACSEEKNDYGWVNPSTDFSAKAISEKEIHAQGCRFKSLMNEVVCEPAKDSSHAFMQKVALLNWQANHINWVRSLNTRTYKKPMNPYSLKILFEKSKQITAYVNSDFTRHLDEVYKGQKKLSLTERTQMFIMDFIGPRGIHADTTTNAWKFSCQTCCDYHYTDAQVVLSRFIEQYENLESTTAEKEFAAGLIESAKEFLDKRSTE